jgi:[ribosomal protein S5]-alanine N-acetyltransferase
VQVQLRELTSGDFAALYEWSQDEVFCRASGWTLGLNREAIETFGSALLTDPPERFLRLGIETGGRLCGYTDLAGIDLTAGTAEFGIAVGPSTNWGRGIGLAAGRLMLAHGFRILGLSRVWAEVHAPNTRSLALMARLGFRSEGVGSERSQYPEQSLYDGVSADMLTFGVSSQHFAATR